MEDREERWATAMRAALEGDRAVYERLLGEVAAMLRGLVRARLSRSGLSADEAEDIVQEVLMALHGKRDTWDRARPFLPWLHAIAEYKMIDAVRRTARARRLTANETVDEIADRLPAPVPEPALADADPARALADLPDRERSVVAAVGVEGLSVRGAAARLAISEGAVRVAFHRGLARLSRRAAAGPAAPRRRG